MPLPTKTPRLAQIDPGAFAEEVGNLVARRFNDLCKLGGMRPAGDDFGNDLFEIAEDLCRYAQTGAPVAVGGGAARALEAVEDALFRRAIDPAGELDVIEELDLATEIGVVLSAAHGRLLLASGKPVPVKLVAALGGTNKVTLHHLIQKGTLVRSSKPPAKGQERQAGILPRTASAWLGSIGVPGFG